MGTPLKLQLLDEKFAICKMPQFAEIPSVFTKGELCFVMRTEEDLTIISPEFMAQNNVQQQAGYRCIRTSGEMPTDAVGIIDSLSRPLADAKICVFVVSTFNILYLFMMEEFLVNATQALQKAGHEFVHEK